MKNSWLFKKLWQALFHCTCFLFALNSYGVDSPESVSGWAFDFVITDGVGGYASSGKFRFIVLDSGKNFRIFEITGGGYRTGSMTYARTAADIGRISFNDDVAGPGCVLTLDFAKSSYTLLNGSLTGSQSGYFFAQSATAPASIAGKVINVAVNGGSAPFETSGNYRLITTTANSYIKEVTPGVTDSTGTFSYMKTNRASGMFFFSDSDWGNGFDILGFTGPTNGFFLIHDNAKTAYQWGVFNIGDFVRPTFVTQPASRSVPVGNATTFSATVTGTGPFSFQWYKNNVPISGATSSTYTIPFVDVTDAGNYRIVASNAGASVSSTNAVLTAVCSYTLSPASAAFDYSGGNGSIDIGASGSCPWFVTNSSSWITITSATNGSGIGSITYTVGQNTNDFARVGFFKIGNKTFPITQTGRLAPQSVPARSFLFTLTNDVSTNAAVFKFETRTNGLGNRLGWFFQTSSPENFSTTALPDYQRVNETIGVMTFSAGDVTQQYTLTFTSVYAGVLHYEQLDTNGQVVDDWSGHFASAPNKPDLNNDPFTDFVFQNTNISTWFMRGTNFLGTGLIRNGTPVAPGWHAMAMGDFNEDGQGDILLQHDTGKLAVWLMNGTNLVSTVSLRNGTPATAGWHVAGVSDFNNDGHIDILFQHDSRTLAVWYMNKTNFVTTTQLRNGVAASPGWSVVGLNDFNQDGQTDIIWQHTNGQIAVWYFVGKDFVNVALLRNGTAAGPGWKVAGVADFDFNGSNDLLFQHSTGKLAVWFFDGSNFVRTSLLRNGQPAAAGLILVGPK